MIIFQILLLLVIFTAIAYFLRDFYFGAMTIIVGVILIAILSCTIAHAQNAPTVADPAYSNMQRAVGGIIQQRALASGHSVTDPKTYSTLYSVGKTAAAVAAGAGAGFLLAGSAPAWVTLVAASAVVASVTWAVNLALDKSYSWTISNNSTTVTVNEASQSSTIYPANYLINVSGTDVNDARIGFLNTSGGLRYYNFPDADYWSENKVMILKNNNGSPYESELFYIKDHPSFSCVYKNNSGFYNPDPAFGSSNNGKYCSSYANRYVIICFNSGQSAGSGINTSNSNLTIPSPRYCNVYTVVRNYLGVFQYDLRNASPSAPTVSVGGYALYPYFSSSSGPTSTTSQKTVANAVSTMSPATKAKPVDYSTMAMMINDLWKRAAAEQGYSGLPYQVTSPITETEVKTWAEANPQSYPTVEALTAPVTSGAVGFSPSTTTSTSTTVDPATSPLSPTQTNPNAASQKIDLGPDPNIGYPNVEAPPNAAQILQPLLSLMPDLRAYSVPTHSAICPKPAFDVFGKTIIMEQHCNILEQQRSSIYAASLLAFMLMALFVILSA